VSKANVLLAFAAQLANARPPLAAGFAMGEK